MGVARGRGVVRVARRVPGDGDGEAVAKALPHEGNKIRGRAEAVFDGLPSAIAVRRRVAAEDHEASDAGLRSVSQDSFCSFTSEIGTG